MCTRLACLSLLLPALVLAAPAQAADPEAAARFIDLVRSNSCSLAATEVESDLGAAGISPYALLQVMRPLLQANLIAFSIGYERVILNEALCAAPLADDVATFADVLAAYDPDAEPELRQVIDLAYLDELDEYEPGYLGLMIFYYADAADCAIDLTDRDAAVANIVVWVAESLAGMDADPTLRSDVAAALAVRVGAELDGPPEGFTAEPGRLVLQDC